MATGGELLHLSHWIQKNCPFICRQHVQLLKLAGSVVCMICHLPSILSKSPVFEVNVYEHFSSEIPIQVVTI